MRLTVQVVVLAGLMLTGCRQFVIDAADREVYRLIQSRQLAALGEVHDANVGTEAGDRGRTSSMYAFVPRPIDSGMSSAFDDLIGAAPPEPPASARAGPDEGGDGTAASGTVADRSDDDDADAPDQPLDPASATSTDNVEDTDEPPDFSLYLPEHPEVLSISDALAYAMRHAREFQDAKEDLYLAALDLTLERHLWTPQLAASISAEYADFERGVVPDRALDTVAQASATQRLPLGGTITARVISALTRDLSNRVTIGESGDAILDANIPLLRGAGRVAYESRYRTERALIYAVRDYERFRRAFLVRLAGDYFRLQETKAGIVNAQLSYESLEEGYRRAEAFLAVGQNVDVFDAPRAKSSWRRAEASLINALERHALALDRFKITIGMPVDAPLGVVAQERDVESDALETLVLDLGERVEVAIALGYRLDLLNSADRVDDARRGLVVSRNQLLPDLDLSGSVSYTSDPNRLSSLDFDRDRETWRGMMTLSMDDRKSERTAYRASLVSLRRSERFFEERADIVRSDVRSARRRLAQQRRVKRIEELSVEDNELREAAAKAQYALGTIENRDLVEANNDLLRARNGLAGARADYRRTLLEYLRDTGMLRVTDEGMWHLPRRLQELRAAKPDDPDAPNG